MDIIQGDIEKIVENPEKYAMDFIEINFARYVQRYVLAHKLGKDFAKKNKRGGSLINAKKE